MATKDKDKQSEDKVISTRDEAIAEGMDARVLPSDDETIRDAGIKSTGRFQENRNKNR